ncbi:bacteriohemerythrin [Aestuariispira ectoiniformans]|uniref:bacteriohemerythrin n=1 Tax=Aestuariispira ectoiniformans TaxID=2775080 RepID=UPI00223B2334|nr:hemerythrin family protein [Aestuariispira ectoiniformans]
MSFFEWTPEMSVGLARLDDDHKGLIAIINRLAETCGKPDQHAVIEQAFRALLRYTEVHFGREEAVLNAVHYASLQGHRHQHHDFIKDILELRHAFGQAGDEETQRELLDYLKDWLTNHIMIEDMAYKSAVEHSAIARDAAERFSSLDIWTTR